LCSKPYAIVGFPVITTSAGLLCDLLRYNLDIFTVHNIDEVQRTLVDLKHLGYKMVLGDTITNTTAKHIGLNAILITSGNESIITAFDQATKLCRSYFYVKNDNRFLEDVIKGQDNSTVVFDSEQNIFFSTFSEDRNEHILEVLKEEVTETLTSGRHKFFKNIEGQLYSIISEKINSHTKDYVAFYFSSDYVPMARSKYGIKYSTRKEIQELYFNSFSSITNASNDMHSKLTSMNQSNNPIMIMGEIGTGKTQTANLLYSQSKLSHNPLITINCPLISEKGWGFLTNHYNSPLNNKDNTLFFKDLNSLTESWRKELLSIIVDINVQKRNRVILSCAKKKSDPLPDEAFDYINKLSCMTIMLPPLSERVEEIPTLSSLLLNTLNIDLAKQIIGFEPEALALLQEYTWPYNYSQFKRILHELVVLTSSPYINAKIVNEVLKKEPSFDLSSSNLSNVLDSSLTLNEINHQLTHMMLNETKGNQSEAAKRLGISRTTLWRYLKG